MNIIQFSEDEDFLDLRYDHVFKAVFARNSQASKFALSDLISSLIGRTVKVETVAANEPPVESETDRRMRFDICCTAKTGELVNIEMSLDPGSFLPERFEYHEAKLFIGQDIHGKGKDYLDLKEAYQITILSSDLFFPDNELIHTFKYYDSEHGLSLNGKTRIVAMELIKAKQAIEKPAVEMSGREAWAAYFQYLTNKEKRAKINEIVKHKEGIAMASKTLSKISPSQREYLLRLSEEKYILDAKSKRIQAWRKGLAEGMSLGRVEGKAEGMTKVARNMKSMGFSDEQIRQATGLSIEEIEKAAMG